MYYGSCLQDGVHFSEGGYDRIAAKLFREINVDCYYLEYDTERAGTFEPLKFFPKNKSVVLGLISSKVPQVRLSVDSDATSTDTDGKHSSRTWRH